MPRSSLTINPPDLPISAVSLLDTSGSVHDSYELLEHRLGRGHFSEVRLALTREGRQRVAVKITPKRAGSTLRIQSEIAILRQCTRLQHPNVLRLLAVFETEADIFMVLEYLHGGSLLELLTRDGSLPEADSRPIMRQIASGLKAVHDAGIVHRDVKPENILFDGDGIAKLVDFGFAKAQLPRSRGDGSASPLLDESMRFASSPCGTPGFVAPEVLQHTGYNFAVDMWSLGVITYMCLFGQPPFSDSPHTTQIGTPFAGGLTRAPEDEEVEDERDSPEPDGHDSDSAVCASRHNSLSVPGEVHFGAEPHSAALYNSSAPTAIASSGSAESGSRCCAAHLAGLQIHGSAPGSAPGWQTSFGVNSTAPPDSPSIMRKNALLSRCAAGAFTFPASDTVSPAARSFITALLQVDPASRLTAQGALQHSWLLPRRISAAAADGGGGGSSSSSSSSSSHVPLAAVGAVPKERSSSPRPSSPHWGSSGASRGGGQALGGSPIGSRPASSCEPSNASLPLSPASQRRETGKGDGQSTPEGARLITQGRSNRGLLPDSSSEDDGSDDDGFSSLTYRRAGSGSHSQRMTRPPPIGRMRDGMASRRAPTS